MTQLIGIKQLAALLKISLSSLYKHSSGIKRCELLNGMPEPAFRGGRTLWIQQDIDDWLASRRTFRPDSAAPAPQPEPQPRRPRGRPFAWDPARRATQDPAHYAGGIAIERDDEPESSLRRKDIVREVARQRGVTIRRAQQLVKQQIERVEQGDLFMEGGVACT